MAVAALAIHSPSAAEDKNPTPLLTNVLVPEQPSWAKNHPRILFNPAELARVQKRIQDDPEIADLWNKLKTLCDGYLDPKSVSYVDASKAFDDYLLLKGGSHEAQGRLEGTLKKWTTPLDLLSFAYIVSGDERYGKKAVELALAIAKKLPLNSMNAGFFYTRTFATRSVALALDWCYPLLTSDERQSLRQWLVDSTNNLYYQSLNNVWGQSTLGRIWNWNGGIATTWGLAAIVLDGETNAPTRQWIFQAARNEEDYLRFGTDAQGGVIEGPSYFGYGAGDLPYFVEGLKARTGEDLYAETNYKHFAQWLPLEILPGGGRVNNIEDSNYTVGATEAPLYALYREPDRALARYLWEELYQRAISPPTFADCILWAPEKVPEDEIAARVAKLPDYGWAGGRSLVVSRSGFGPDDAYMSFHAQHYTAIKHDHADKGQFTFYAYGDDLAIDSGYGNDASPEKSTSGFAHNQVMVDGHPELMGSYHAQTDGWIVNSLHEELVDLSCADVADAYRFFYKPDISYQKEFQQDFQRADRHILFIRIPFPYAVVFDDVKKDNDAHDYTWLLHTKDGKTFQRVGNSIQVVPADTTPETVVLRPMADENSSSGPSMDGATKWDATLQVPKAGKYQVWGLTGTATPDGEKSNSFFLRINGGKMGFSQGSMPDRFIWDTYPKLPLAWVPLNDENGDVKVPAFDFQAGPVQFELSDREDGADCAAIALVPDGVTMPAGNNPVPDGVLVVRASEGEISGAMQRQQLPPPVQTAWLQVGFLIPDQWEDKIGEFLTTTEGTHSRLSVTMHGNDGQFLTLLVPHRLKDNKPDGASNIQSIPAQKGHAGLLTVTDDASDLVACWDGQGIAVQSPVAIDTDAELLWLRRDAAGKIVGAAASNVSYLNLGGQPVFTSNGGKTCFVLDGAKARVPEEADVKFNLPGEEVEVEKVKRATDWFASRPANE